MSESGKSSSSSRSRSSSTSSASSSDNDKHVLVSAVSRKSESSGMKGKDVDHSINSTDQAKTSSQELKNMEGYRTAEEEKQMLLEKSAASFSSKNTSRANSDTSINGVRKTSSDNSAISLPNEKASSKTNVNSRENRRTIPKSSETREQNSRKNSALPKNKRTPQQKNAAGFRSKQNSRANSTSSTASGRKTPLNDSATSLTNVRASSKSSVSSRQSQRTPTKSSKSEPSSSKKNSVSSSKSSASNHEEQRAPSQNSELVHQFADAADNNQAKQNIKTEEIKKNFDTSRDLPASVKKETSEFKSSLSEVSDKKESTKIDAKSSYSEKVTTDILVDRRHNNDTNDLQVIHASNDTQASFESSALPKTTSADDHQEMAALERLPDQRSTSRKSSLRSIEKVQDSSSLSSGSKQSSIAGSRASSVTSNKRKSSFPTLISPPSADKTEGPLDHKISNPSDLATRLPSLVSEQNEKQDITIEAVEKLLLHSEQPKINLLQEQQVTAAKSESRPGSVSSTSSSSSSSSQASSKSLVSLPNADHEIENRSQTPPPNISGHRTSSTTSNSSAESGIGELSSMQFGRLRSKRTRPKTPNSLKEYARNASREGTAAAMLKASRRSTMDGSIYSVGSKSRIAALDAGNLAGDAFVDDSDQDQVILTRRLSATVRQVLLGQHLPDHLKARHLAGIFVTGVVSKNLSRNE